METVRVFFKRSAVGRVLILFDGVNRAGDAADLRRWRNTTPPACGEPEFVRDSPALKVGSVGLDEGGDARHPTGAVRVVKRCMGEPLDTPDGEILRPVGRKRHNPRRVVKGGDELRRQILRLRPISKSAHL